MKNIFTPITTNFSSQFELELIDALQPIRQFVLATAIYHLFSTGLFEELNVSQSKSADDIANRLSMNHLKLAGFLKYLRNENLVSVDNGNYCLTEKAKKLEPFKGWYTMLIGGYAETYLQIGENLNLTSDWATRNATKVGIGSCEISHYDAIPLTKALMNEVAGGCHKLLDLGCGNGMYLVDFCKSLPNITAWGAEPDFGGYCEAQRLIKESGLENRVKISNFGAIEFLDSEFDFSPDFIVLGFILHEILGQEGRDGVIQFLQKIISKFPDINIIVIEVDNRIDESRFAHHELAMSYYNPYYLLHYFTRQLLMTDEYWTSLFTDAGLSIQHKKTTCQKVDSTMLELGYLLKIST
jgi:2-ketoarginine methyltransferase